MEAYTDKNGVVHPIRDSRGYNDRYTSGYQSRLKKHTEKSARYRAQKEKIDRLYAERRRAKTHAEARRLEERISEANGDLLQIEREEEATYRARRRRRHST